MSTLYHRVTSAVAFPPQIKALSGTGNEMWKHVDYLRVHDLFGLWLGVIKNIKFILN